MNNIIDKSVTYISKNYIYLVCFSANSVDWRWFTGKSVWVKLALGRKMVEKFARLGNGSETC